MGEVRKIQRVVRGVRAAGRRRVPPAAAIPQVGINDPKFYPIYAKCVELGLPIFVCAGVPGPRLPAWPQHVERIDQVMYDFPDLIFVTRHGCEPWEELAVKLMLKWPNLYYSTSAFAPKYYPEAIVNYANKRGADKVIYAGYFPIGLFARANHGRHGRRAVPRPRVAQIPARERRAHTGARLMRILLGLALLVALVVGGVLFYLDQLVGASIEYAGEAALGVPTKVGVVTMKPFRGEFGVTSVRIGNPAGYTTPYFAHLGDVRLYTNLSSLRQEPVHIPRVVVSDIDLQLERSDKGTNYGDIIANVSGPEETSSDDEPAPVIIEELVIQGIEANLLLNEEAKPLELDIPPITLRNVGSDEGGISQAELVSLITRTVLMAVAKNTDALPSLVLAELQGQLRKLPAIGQVSDETVRQVGREAEKLIKGIGGLLGR